MEKQKVKRATPKGKQTADSRKTEKTKTTSKSQPRLRKTSTTEDVMKEDDLSKNGVAATLKRRVANSDQQKKIVNSVSEASEEDEELEDSMIQTESDDDENE